MSLTRTIAHNTALQIAGKIVSTLFGLAAVALMMHYLGTERFGWYGTANGFLQFVGIMTDFGFVLVISNLLSEPTFSEERVLSTVTTWRLITAIVVQALAPLIFLLFPYPWTVKLAVIVLSGAFFASSLGSVFMGYYRARLRLWHATVGEVLGRAALAAGVAAVVYGGFGFLWMMAAVTAGSLVTLVYYWYQSPTIRLSIDWNVSRVMFHKMWPTALSIIFNALYYGGDRVILPLYVSATEVGLYSAAYRILDLIVQIAAMVMGIIMPLITYAWSRGLVEEFKHRYQLGLDLLTLILLPLLAGGIALGEQLMVFVGGPTFAGAGWMFQWLAIAIFGICFGMVFGHIALAIGRQRESLWVFVTDSVLSVVGYFVFIPKYGVWGAIGVTIFSEFYAGFFLAALTIHYSKIAPRLVAFNKILLASLFMGLLVYQARTLPVIIAITIGAVAYGALVLLFRVVSPTTIAEVVVFTRVAKE